MTREEAIEWLIQIQDKYIHDGDEQFDTKRKEALGMAIKALKSDRPNGEWINGRCDQCGGHAPFWPMASTYHKSKFCPDCGARMLKGEGNEND